MLKKRKQGSKKQNKQDPKKEEEIVTKCEVSESPTRTVQIEENWQPENTSNFTSSSMQNTAISELNDLEELSAEGFGLNNEEHKSEDERGSIVDLDALLEEILKRENVSWLHLEL